MATQDDTTANTAAPAPAPAAEPLWFKEAVRLVGNVYGLGEVRPGSATAIGRLTDKVRAEALPLGGVKAVEKMLELVASGDGRHALASLLQSVGLWQWMPRLTDANEATDVRLVLAWVTSRADRFRKHLEVHAKAHAYETENVAQLKSGMEEARRQIADAHKVLDERDRKIDLLTQEVRELRQKNDNLQRPVVVQADQLPNGDLAAFRRVSAAVAAADMDALRRAERALAGQ